MRVETVTGRSICCCGDIAKTDYVSATRLFSEMKLDGEFGDLRTAVTLNNPARVPIHWHLQVFHRSARTSPFRIFTHITSLIRMWIRIIFVFGTAGIFKCTWHRHAFLKKLILLAPPYCAMTGNILEKQIYRLLSLCHMCFFNRWRFWHFSLHALCACWWFALNHWLMWDACWCW